MPKTLYPLTATALIEQQGDDEEVLVWLCHDNPQNHPDNHSFVAGRFETFDAAVAALLAVRGMTIEKILKGPKFAEAPEQEARDAGGGVMGVNPFAFASEFRYAPAQQGMTLRDYFAAHAPDPPHGWMGTADTLERLSRPDGKIAALIEWRWFYADAMLAGRELPKQEVVGNALA